MKGGADMKISNAIAEYMNEKEIKQKFLSKQTNLSCDAISGILNGKRKLEVEEYAEICKALNVSFDFFYDISRNEIKSA